MSTYPDPDYSPWFKTRAQCESYLRYAERKAALSGIRFDPEPQCESEPLAESPTAPTQGSPKHIVGWGLFTPSVRPDGPPVSDGAYDSKQDCECAREMTIRYRHGIPPLPVCRAVGPRPEVPGVLISHGIAGGPSPKCGPGEIGVTASGQPCWNGPIYGNPSNVHASREGLELAPQRVPGKGYEIDPTGCIITEFDPNTHAVIRTFPNPKCRASDSEASPPQTDSGSN